MQGWNRLRALFVALVAWSTFAVGAGSALADSGNRVPHLWAYGQVTAVLDHEIQIAAAGGNSLSFAVPDRARVFYGAGPAALGDVAQGDWALVFYRVTPAGPVADRVIFDDVPFATGPPHVVVGQVAQVSSSGFVLTLDDNSTLAVAYLPGARLRKDGKEAKLSDLAVGDFVRAVVRSSDNLTDAFEIDFSDRPIGLPTQRLEGVVTSVASGQLALRTADGITFAITVVPSADVRLSGRLVNLDAVPLGSQAVVFGSRFDQVFYGWLILATPPTPPGGGS